MRSVHVYIYQNFAIHDTEINYYAMLKRVLETG